MSSESRDQIIDRLSRAFTFAGWTLIDADGSEPADSTE
jgi:hypothetical protein